MGKKLTIEEVKRNLSVLRPNLIVLDDTYVSSSTKIRCACECGDEFYCSYNNLTKGNQCKTCGIKKQTGSQALGMEVIKGRLKIQRPDLIILSENYINCKEKLHCICECGNDFYCNYEGLNRGNQCRECRYKKSANSKLTGIDTIKGTLKNIRPNLIVLDTKYLGDRYKLHCICECGDEYWCNYVSLKLGHQCKKCGIKKNSEKQSRANEYNCIATTHPHLVKYFVNIEDAHKYKAGSKHRSKLKCPDCGILKEITMNSLSSQGFGCNNCGDGVSFSEKIMTGLLMQLNLDFKKEHSPEWVGDRRYDFYIEELSMIIETHGIQHYEQSTRGRTLEEEQENDRLKEQLAKENGVENYIVIDCRKSELEFVKDNIIKSKISNVVDLSTIKWDKCLEYAMNNLSKKCCELWNSGEFETVRCLAEYMSISNVAVSRYLKTGTELKWCNYNGKEELIKSNSKNGKKSCKAVEIFKNEVCLGVFPSVRTLDEESEELFGIKLLRGNIASVCRGETPQYKGYTFKYIE